MNLGKPSSCCDYIWYIEGSEPKILVDAGATTEWFTSRGLDMENIQSVEEGLGKLGLKPEDIDIVIMTHLHGDHVELAHKYASARFIIQKAEIDFALNPHPMVVKLGSFSPRYFKDLNIEVIEGDKEIIDGVGVMLTPGHTFGGQSVVVDTPEGTAVITGFCCSLDNFNPPPEARGLEVVASGRHYDVLQAYDSVLKVKQSGYHVIPLHESSFIGRDRLP